MALHTIELFAGVGMLGEGLRAGLEYLGHKTRSVCYVEREAYPAAVLAQKMASGVLDNAPIWSDVTTFDGESWRGKVHGVVAGFPCQDLSVSGKRVGLDGKRSGLFFEVLRIAHDCDAQWLFLENVAGIYSADATAVDQSEEINERAVARVLGELSDGGWNAEWTSLRASDVGASHHRNRWFCFAWRRTVVHTRCDERRENFGGRSGGVERNDGARETNCGFGESMFCLDDPKSERLRETRAGSPTGSCAGVGGSGSKLGSAARKRFEWGGETDHESRRQVTDASTPISSRILFAPGPTDERWSSIIAAEPSLAPAVEKTAKREVCGVDDGLAREVDDTARQHQLRACGNGVVPLQSAIAFIELFRRSGIKL